MPLKTTEEWNRMYACMAPDALIKAVRAEGMRHAADLARHLAQKFPAGDPAKSAEVAAEVILKAADVHEGK